MWIFDFLFLWPWSWPWADDLRMRTWTVFTGYISGCVHMNFVRQGFRKLSSNRQIDRQTDRHGRNYIPRRFAGGQKLNISLHVSKGSFPSPLNDADPRVRSRFGCRSFRVSGPTIWNDLPVDIRSTDITRELFKRSLKSWLFECAYGRRRVWETVQSEGAPKKWTYLLTYLLSITLRQKLILRYYGIWKQAGTPLIVVCLLVFIKYIYTVSQKNGATIPSFITLPNVGKFSTQFFRCCILQETCNKTYATLPTTP